MKDLSREQFGRLTVEKFSHRDSRSKAYFLCKCSCGNNITVAGYNLKSGNTMSCGCLKHPKDLSRLKFGRLTVISRTDNKKEDVVWNCKCDCGNIVKVRGHHLKQGKTVSCGCFHKEITKEIHTTHDMSITRVYRIRMGVLQRCNNPKNEAYHNYGGRGIYVCERWTNSFEHFYEDMGEPPTEKHQLERINNDGPYSPENCCWATQQVQLRNTRRNHFITFKDKTRCVVEWAEQLGINLSTLNNRIYNGWADSDVLSVPVGMTRKDYHASLQS